MAQIATVMAVNGSGTAVIVDANGNTRPAVAGAPVMRGETVRTTGGARVELMMEDGDVVAINPNQTVRVDENMAQGDARPTPQEGGVASQSVDQVLQALEQGGDLTEELEAPAAGLGGGGGEGEGGGIVQLVRISEGTDPLSYNYNTALTEPDFEFDLDPDQPVTLDFAFGLEEESVSGLNGNDETDDGLASSRSGNFLDGVGGVLTVITVVGLGAVPIGAGGTTVAFDVDGQPIPTGSETSAAVLLTVFPNGEYSLQVVGRLNHPTPGSDEEQLTLPGITLSGIAGTGGPFTGNLSVTVQDDVPELVGGEEAPSVSVTVAENDILTRLSQGTSPNDGNSDGSYTGSPTRFFDSGPANASGSIAALVSFGADGRGENGFSFSDDLASLVEQGLTSKGEELQYRVEGNTLIAFVGESPVASLPGDDDFVLEEGMEAGPERVVFTLELQPNGDFAFRLYDQLDHAPGEGNNNLPIEFAGVVVATDGDGDPVRLETGFTVNITDDTPREAGWIPVIRVVEEEALPAGNQELNDIWPDVASVSGSLSSQVNGGADDDIVYNLNPEGERPVLTSRGEPVEYRVEGNTLTAFVAATDGSAERPVFTLTLSNDGSYTFTLQGQLDHAPGQGENLLSLDLSSFVVATDFDQDSVVLDSALLIKVVDDQPVIEVAKTQHLSESFETFTTRLTGNSWTVVAENGGVVNGNQGIRWTLNEAGIEIQRGDVGNATPSDGNFKAELDANNNAGGSPNTLTVLSTVLDVPSSTFTMKFDYQPRPTDKGDSGMVVSLGGVNVTVSSSAAGVVSVAAPEGVTALQTSAAGGWTTITLTFSGVTPGLNTLSFQGLSDNANGDTLGALLDNIKLSANNPILVDETQLSVDATSGTAAALFSVSFGADGAAATNSIAYALTARNGTSTGLTDTATGQDVKVLLGTGADAGKVFGVVTEDGAQKVVFVMGVDPVTGMVSFDQQRAVVHPDGSNPNDTVSLSAGVIGLKLTATDADGDPVSAKVDVGRLVSIYDDAPSAAMSGDRIRVDEDGLPGANADAGRAGEVAGSGSTEASGSIVDNVSWGADGFGRVTGVSGGGAVGTPDGSGGFTISNADYTLVVRADGSYTFTLNRAQTHTAEGEDLKALLAEGFTVSAVDKDGDAVPGGITIAVDVQDDIPTVDVASAVELTLSITNFGETSAGYNNSFGYYIKDAEGKPTTGVIVWDNVKNFTNTSVTITGFTEDQIGFFVIPDGDRLNSSITPDTPVTFQLVAGKWQAFAGGVALTGNGGANVLFDTASLNPNGKSQVQDNAKPGNLNWEDINAGGDNDYDDINIGVEWSSSLPKLQTSDANTVGEASDVAVSTSNFAGSFSFAASFGADGPGTTATTYALTVGLGGATGLTQNGVAVVLALGEDGVLRGFAGDDTPVFSIAVDADGVVTLTQFEQVDHPGEGADGNTANNSAKIVGLPDGLVLLTATRDIVDADGDKASDSATIDISESFSFLDDVPAALSDSDTVVDGVAEGNVMTAAGTTGETGADDVGADTPVTVTGLTQGESSAALEDGTFVLEGQFGTLVMQANGQYTYTADPSKTTTVAANADQIGAVNGAAKAFTLGASLFTADGLYNPAGATGTVSTSGAFLGVAGAPAGQSVPQQINYVGSASEALAFGFGMGVSSATVGFSNLFQNENGGEAARWHAFDAAGNWVGSGVISENAGGAPYANSTAVTFTSNNAGTFTVSNIGVFTTLVVEAVPYANDGSLNNDDSDFFARVEAFQVYPDGEGLTYTDTFGYTITDGDGDTAQATLTISGERPDPGEPMQNLAPVAVGNTYEVVPGGSAAGNVITDDETEGGAATGRDWDQDTPVLNLSVKAVQWGDGEPVTLASGVNEIRLSQGTLFIEPNGTFRYEPDRGASGEESFNYILQDVKGGVSEPALVTIGLPAPLGEWFIPQADNFDRQPTPDKTLVEGAGPQAGSWAFNVNYKQSAGSYAIAQGEKVTVTLDLWTPPGAAVATFGKDYALGVTGKNGFVVDGWSLENGKLVVTVTPDTKGAPAPNLVGVVFEVSITALSDVVTESAGELVGFDILGAEHQIGSVVKPLGAGQESNDDVLIKIEDPEGTLLKAWSDNNNDGVLNQGDNLPKAFEVTQTQIDNSADAGNWIGNTLREGRALTTTQVANNMPRDLTLKVTSDVTFTFVSEGAGYKNAVGWYDLANPGVGFVVWGNASAQGSGGNLTSTSQVTVEDVPAGTQLAFFLIPDGHSLNSGGVPDKVYFKDGKAYADEGHTQLVNSNGGSNPGAVWFSNENGAGAKNLDGLQHAVTGLGQNEPASKLYVGFEDVAGGGDRDFNDVIFTVDLGSGNEIQFDPVVFDLGVDINYGGLLEGAVVEFSLADGDSVFFDNAKANSLGLKVETTDGKKFAISSVDDSPNGALDYNDLLDTFSISVGNTGVNEDFTQVSTLPREASVTLLDLAGNFSDPVKATFNIDVKLPDQA